MSRWNDTLQSPFRGNKMRCPVEMIRWPAVVLKVTPSSIGNSTIGRSSARWGNTETACDPAANLASTTPSALRCDAVAWPVWTVEAGDG